MIINKTQLGENWPFTVDEVEIKWHKKYHGYGLKYDNLLYAVSGILENYGCLPLDHPQSRGLWADDPDIPPTESGVIAKKSLSPLFEYLETKCPK